MLVVVRGDFNSVDQLGHMRIANRFVEGLQPKPGDSVRVRDWDGNTCLAEVITVRGPGICVLVDLDSWADGVA